MDCYRKPSIAILVPLVLVLAVYAVSSLAALSTPTATRSLQNETTSLEMLALMTKCTCMEGNIFCSDIEALGHCKCEGPEEAMMVHCEEHDDHDSHDDHHDSHDDHHEDHDGPKPWGKVILISLLINVTTLTGTFIIAGHWLRKAICKGWDPDPSTGRLWINVIIPMFAAGALSATSFFLLLPEALHIISDGLAERLEDGDHDDHDHRLLGGDHGHGDGPHVEEVDITWRWGASTMGGFLFPVLLHVFFPSHTHEQTHTHDHTHDEDDAEGDAEANRKVDETAVTAGADEGQKADSKTENTSSDIASDDGEYLTFCCVRMKNVPLFLSFNLGEMLHCFTDGIFVGAAYMGCGNAMGNSVTVATIAHEIPNQLAGYLVMVNQNGINPWTAILLNFLFGLIVLVGAIVVLVAEPGNVGIGSIFAIGAGIFIHVSATEMLGLAERSIERQRWWVYVFLSFFVGAVLIGLVLLDHVHCGGHH